MMIRKKAVQFGIGLPSPVTHTIDSLSVGPSGKIGLHGCCRRLSSWPPLCACRRQGMAADAAPALA